MVQQAFRVDQVSTSNIEFKSNSFISSIAADATLASNVHLVLPTSVGSSGQVLATDGSGNLSFVSQGVGGPADLVQDNVTSLTSTVDSFGVYANNTFGADGSNVSVANVTSQEFSIDGSTNTFTLVNTTDNANKLLVSYGGIAQKPSDYIVSNTDLTLSNTRPLVSGTTVEVRYLDFEFAGSVTNTGNAGIVAGGATTVIAPFAFARVADTVNASGTNISWSNWNSSNGTLDFTFSSAQSNTDYIVVSDAETFDDYYVGITNKTVNGFRASFYDGSGNRTPSSSAPFALIIYGATPTVDVNSLSGTSYSTTLYSNISSGVNTFNSASTPSLATYTAGKIGVYRNGVKLPATDYTATDGTSLVLNNATIEGDDIEVVNFGTVSVSLDDVTDVDLTTNVPTNGQALIYVSANSKWEPGSVASSYGNSDVDTHLNQSTASTDQVLSWDGSDYAWVDQSAGGSSGSSTPALTDYEFTATANQTSFAATYIPGSVQVFLNGVKLANTEFTATSGTSIVLGSNTASGDTISVSKIGGSSNLTVANASASSTGSISYDSGSEVLTYTPPDLSGYQSTLVSNTNIKTINGNSVLGSGNITISSGGGVAGTLGSLTKSFANNESATITLSSNVSPVPNVSVFKEVPQAGFSSKGKWDVNANATNYEFYDEKPYSTYASATLTPSATGDGTFTLSSGSFASSDVGKKVVGNSGSAIITSAAGAYKSITPFADTSAISSWQLFGAQGKADGSGIELSSVLAGGGAIDLDNISYTSNSFTISTTNTYGMSFGNGGLKLYYLRSSNNRIYQFNLSTAYDITGATSAGDFTFPELPVDVNFNDTGTKMYFIGSTKKMVLTYTLSTPWDVTSASSDNEVYLPNGISSSYIEDLTFKPDGTKCYVINRVTNYLHQFNLSTAWNISTGSLVSNVFVNIGSPISLEFDNTGTKLFVLAQNDRVKQLNLSTAWDISTASLSSTTGPNFDTQDTSSRSFVFNNNGTKMYMFGASSDSVYQYSLSPAYSISTATYDNVSLSASSYSTSMEWAKFSPNGSYLYMALGNGYYSKLYKFSLSTAWDLSTASYVSNFPLHFNSDYLASSTYAIEFGNNGNNLYILEREGIYNKSLSSQNITDLNDNTTTMANSLTISGAEANPYGFVFNNDGSKLYIMGSDKISEHNLSTAYDVSTATYNNVYFDFTSQISAYSSYFFDFNSDGTVLLILDHANDIIYQYSLSSAFDLSTVSYTNTSTNAISNEGTHTYGIEISDDDSSVFILQTSSVNSVFEYNFESLVMNYNSYSPALTNSSTGQINSSTWTDINSMTADETKNGGDIFYAVSTDNRTSWGVAKASDGVRKIVKNNSGTWQYNNSSTAENTFDHESWVNGTNNNEHATLQEALGAQSDNRMNKAQLDAVADAYHFSQDSADTLDLMIAPYAASGASPVSDGVTINYDAEALVKQAINGTDYEAYFPSSNSVSITSLAAQNLKVRII